MHKMTKIIDKEPHKLTKDDVGNLTLGVTHHAGLLDAERPPIEDLVPQARENIMLPATARGHKIVPVSDEP